MIHDFRDPHYIYVEDKKSLSAITSKLFENTCVECGVSNYILLDEKNWELWRKNNLVQNVFPWLTMDQREILITGTHYACWNKLFD